MRCFIILSLLCFFPSACTSIHKEWISRHELYKEYIIRGNNTKLITLIVNLLADTRHKDSVICDQIDMNNGYKMPTLAWMYECGIPKLIFNFVPIFDHSCDEHVKTCQLVLESDVINKHTLLALAIQGILDTAGHSSTEADQINKYKGCCNFLEMIVQHIQKHGLIYL